MNSYDRAYRVFIDPTFGLTPIAEVSPVEIGDWLDGLFVEHDNTDKVFKAFQVLRLIFNEALRQQVIPFNPVLAIKYPRKAMKPARRSRDRVLTMEQYGALLDACRTPRQRLQIEIADDLGHNVSMTLDTYSHVVGEYRGLLASERGTMEEMVSQARRALVAT